MASEPRNRWGIPLTIVVLAFIGWLTLLPAPEDAETAARSGFLCLWPCNVEGLRDAVLNILLFIPLGFALRLWRPARTAVLACLATTAGIELTQQLFLLGRDASLRDLLTNALGGFLGAGLATTWRSLVFPAPSRAAQLAALGLGGWLLLVTITAFGMRPWLPSPPFWGQHAAELGQFELYRGKLLEAQINGHPFPGGRATDSDALGALIASDSLRVDVTVISGPPPADVAPIVSVFDGTGHQVLLLGQAGPNLVFVRRTGLEAAELASQNVVLEDFAGHLAGDTVRISAGVDRGEVVIRSATPSASSERRVRLSAGWLWTGLSPFYRQISGTAWLLTALWLGGLLLPGGYWLGRARAGVWSVGWIVGIVAAGLAGATLVAGLKVGAGSEWVGSVAGGVTGWVAGWVGGRRDSSRAEGGRPRGSPLH